MVSKHPTLADRLAHVIQACGYPRDAAFTDAIGLRPQNLRNWRERGSISRASLERIKHATGASMDWMATGEGEPFPEGPILFAGASASSPGAADRIAKLEHDLDTLAGVVGKLIRSVGRIAPPEAAKILAALQEARQADPAAPAFLDALLATAPTPPRAPGGGGGRPRRSR